MKADSTIKRHLRGLRADGIEHTDDRILMLVAQAIEYGVRWGREDTRGWTTPLTEAVQLANLLRAEIGGKR